jgi:hypothetical protein
VTSRQQWINPRLGVVTLLLILAAWLLVPDAKEGGVADARPKSTQGGAAKQPPKAPALLEPVEVLRPRNQVALDLASSGQLFRQPAVENPPQVSRPVTATEVAPPPTFNYKVLGSKLEDSAWHVYLEHDDLAQIVGVGAVLESTWRVDRIEPPAMVVTHLPTGITLPVQVGGSR